MKKLYTSTLAVVVATGALMAQSGAPHAKPAVKEQATPTAPQPMAHPDAEERGATIWSDDFSNPANWVIAHYGTFNLDWQIGVGLVNTGGYTTPPIQSTTAGNGYAMLDSDGANNSGTTYESSTMTTVNPVDLSLFPNVILQFENQYRKYTDEQCYVEISTNNTDWITTLDPLTDISVLPNVFYVFLPDGELTQGVSPGNPTVKRINISAVAGGQSTVWIRFHWTGIWGYSWFVDDVSVEEQAQYDVAMVNGFLSHPGNGLEYGRIPSTQLNPTMSMGGDYSNLGVQPQNNVNVLGDAVAFSATTTTAVLAPDETILMDESVALPALATGLYTATFSVTSDEIGSDGFPGNNSYLRTFEVTDEVYSLDGIGNHPPGYESLTSLGTNSFTDNSDGLFVFTMYPIATDFTVTGLEILLANGTVAGGSIIASLHDTTDVLADNPGSPIVVSTEHIVTQWEVDAGRVEIAFPAPEVLGAGGYYAGVELFSNGNTNDIRILDDATVPQPSLASAIHTPSDGVTYTNGNAQAIRLSSSPTIGMAEVHELQGITLYPNPTEGQVTITATTSEKHQVEVANVLGEVIRIGHFNLNTTMDLTGLAIGVYTVRVSTATASSVQRLTIR